ncbi:hypothetical protein EVAR_467_1 [Eumeta japonica]|uniref:Uncharacterized protein n=1 Tax=Eumeta variegata TaxID=151549 RepID=A0A4C1SBD2_EUMVA|nr:hypothetical protein EVAR_467_1 [Eumeta japonica]
MRRPTKRAAHRSHPYCKPLRSSIDHHIQLRQLFDHNDDTLHLWSVLDVVDALATAVLGDPPGRLRGRDVQTLVTGSGDNDRYNFRFINIMHPKLKALREKERYFERLLLTQSGTLARDAAVSPPWSALPIETSEQTEGDNRYPIKRALTSETAVSPRGGLRAARTTFLIRQSEDPIAHA